VARYVDAIDLPVTREEAFDYLADFSRTAEWDPSVLEGRDERPEAIERRRRKIVGEGARSLEEKLDETA
jgi:hypothetical protein